MNTTNTTIASAMSRKQEDREVAGRSCLDVVVDHADVLRQRRDDAGEDDQADAVPDTLCRNLLADPHEEDRSRCQRDGDDQNVHRIRIEDGLLQADGHADGLEESQRYGEVARHLGGFLMPFFAFLAPLLQRRYDDIQQLNDDGSIDVRCDAHGKDGKLAECTTREQDPAGRRGCRSGTAPQELRVDSRNRDVRSHAEDGKHDEREDDLLPKLRDLEDVRKG
jgi:hypothetical protein